MLVLFKIVESHEEGYRMGRAHEGWREILVDDGARRNYLLELIV